jgi:Flp pilus assembly protein TadG
MVEFAFIFPIFLLLVMGVIEFGWALRSYITITNSAREGARYAVTLGPNDPATEDLVKQRAADFSSGLIEPSDVMVTYTVAASTEPVEVKVTHDHKYITPLGHLVNAISGGAIKSPLPMASTSTMRIE